MSISSPAGYTVMELMVTMAVVAILLATAVPSVKDYSWSLRMRTAMDSLQTDLVLARSRAISHNAHSVICPSTNAQTCSGEANWHSGWIVFTDLNDDRQIQAGEPLLKQSGGFEALNITSSRSRTYLRFLPNGSSPGSNISIQFCDQRGADKAGTIIVSNTGRIRLATKKSTSTQNCP